MMGTDRPEFQRQGFADQLNIATPEQVDLRFPVAGIGSRFVAVLIDHLIQFIVYFILFLLLAWWGSSLGPHTPAADDAKMSTAGKWFIAIFTLLNFCLIWGYFALFEAFWHGQTPGKRIMKLRVIKDSGRQITLFEALARNLLRFIDFIPFFYPVGLVAMLCNRKNKRLGDMAAGTLIIHELPADDNAASTFLTGGDFFAKSGDAVAESTVPGDAIARLDANDLHVIETFFTRALDLDLSTRYAMAEKIAQRMVAKMKVPMPEGSPERILETIARAMRGTGRRF